MRACRAWHPPDQAAWLPARPALPMATRGALLSRCSRHSPLSVCSVKKVALRLIETMVDKCDDPDLVAAQVTVPLVFWRCCLLFSAVLLAGQVRRPRPGGRAGES